MPTAGRCPTAAASIISPRRDRLSPETVVRFLASCARHRLRRGRRPGAVRARHGRDAPRLADRLDAGRQLAGERRAGAHRDAVRARHMGLRSEEHTSELQSLAYLVCRLLLEKKKKQTKMKVPIYISPT